jgi:hypothetical protein
VCGYGRLDRGHTRNFARRLGDRAEIVIDPSVELGFVEIAGDDHDRVVIVRSPSLDHDQ